ncbi:hypothetical protein PGTUg99_012255 [Puccinia graminis f. sp. tritici]|uniref:Uncharacterized protein n=1 Tax=Puccinia graminis f. sp. tritici TaxID=56615 RepID=A0A5B0RFN0_PUCGR|nr:hypothetical protein PGTUg99_012255 [Puccinia graminis f. sp. tritici]
MGKEDRPSSPSSILVSGQISLSIGSSDSERTLGSKTSAPMSSSCAPRAQPHPIPPTQTKNLGCGLIGPSSSS